MEKRRSYVDYICSERTGLASSRFTSNRKAKSFVQVHSDRESDHLSSYPTVFQKIELLAPEYIMQLREDAKPRLMSAPRLVAVPFSSKINTSI